MANHRLDAAPDTVHWGYFDARAEAAAHRRERRHGDDLDRVRHGEPDAGRAARRAAGARRDPRSVPQKLPGHICTGPVAVKGAKAGQVLEVRIKDIQLHYDWGYNMIRPLAGALPDDFDTPTLIHIPLDKEKNTGTAAVGPRAAARAVLRRDGGRAAAATGA